MASDSTAKVVVLGGNSVGKTSLVELLGGYTTLNPRPPSRLGIEFVLSDVDVPALSSTALPPHRVRLHVWDAFGLRFRGLPRTYFRRAAIVLLVFDVRQHQEGFDALLKQLEEAKDIATASEDHSVLASMFPRGPLRFILVGTNADRADGDDEGRAAESFAHQLAGARDDGSPFIPYVRVSCRDGSGLDDLRRCLVAVLRDQIDSHSDVVVPSRQAFRGVAAPAPAPESPWRKSVALLTGIVTRLFSRS